MQPFQGRRSRGAHTQGGCSFLASTLGWVIESRWDSNLSFPTRYKAFRGPGVVASFSGGNSAYPT